MHSETHHFRSFLIAVLLALLALFLSARPVHSSWGTEPVQVHGTTALCPLVAATDDASYGAIVVWQENTAAGGVLRANHLLASGDVDAAWSAPASLSTLDVARHALGAVADGTGGAYVWWMENTQLCLTRVSSLGTVATGWPARGRNLGQMASNRNRPSVASDASGGIYVAWVGVPTVPGSAPAVRVRLATISSAWRLMGRGRPAGRRAV